MPTSPSPAASTLLGPAGATARPKHWIGGLDGLRALAVIAVVLFHLNPGYLSGGYLGVDLFFVISGYLITRLLLAEKKRAGRIGLAQFYLRRARRLLPAVLALLAVAGTVGYAAWPDQRSTLPDSALSSLGYVTNWWLITDQQSYFVAMGRPPMLQHLWSLAIEEQYYLLWAPTVIVLGALWVWRRPASESWRPAALIAAVAGGLALVSAAVMAIIAVATNVPFQADSSRVYFGTDTHSMGLLLGSAVGALTAIPWRSVTRPPQRWVRAAWRSTWARRPLLPPWIVGSDTRSPLGTWATDLLAVAGIGGVAWFFVSVDEYVPWLYRGGFLAFAAVAAVAVCCAARPGSRIGRLLDIKPLAWIGQRSYGIYLWHWPVFVVTRPMIDVQGPAWLVDCARTGLAFAIAAVSFRYLETPVRQGTFAASLRRVWSSVGTRRSGPTNMYDGESRPARRRFAHRWAVPALAAGCIAVLASAHLAAVQQPVWAASMPGIALPIPGVEPVLPGGIDGSANLPQSMSAASASPGVSSADSPADGDSAEGGSAEGGSVEVSAGAPGVPPADAASAGASPLAGDPASVGSRADSWAGALAGSLAGGPPVTRAGTVADAGQSRAPEAGGTAPRSGGQPRATTTAPATTASAPATTTAAPPERSQAAAPSSTKHVAAHTTSASAASASTAKVSAFGDSVLLGASKAVRGVVGSMSVDAVVGRQAWDLLADIQAAAKAGSLAPVVLIHTGNNGIISGQQLATTLVMLKSRTKVIMFNDHVDRTWQGPNNKVFGLVNGKYKNLVIVDWNAASSKNPAWFGPDGIHVNAAGAKAYASMVAAAIG